MAGVVYIHRPQPGAGRYNIGMRAVYICLCAWKSYGIETEKEGAIATLLCFLSFGRARMHDQNGPIWASFDSRIGVLIYVRTYVQRARRATNIVIERTGQRKARQGMDAFVLVIHPRFRPLNESVSAGADKALGAGSPSAIF